MASANKMLGNYSYFLLEILYSRVFHIASRRQALSIGEVAPICSSSRWFDAKDMQLVLALDLDENVEVVARI